MRAIGSCSGGLSLIVACVLLLVPPPARADELLVMPYSCRVVGGQPVLTPSDDQGHAVIGRREQREFRACSPVNPRLCRRWNVHRFDLDCGGVRVPWVEVAAAADANRGGRAFVSGGRLEIEMPPRWSLAPDAPCAREGDVDGWRFSQMRRFCAERLDRVRRITVAMPPGFAPMMGIDGIFVTDSAPRGAVAAAGPPRRHAPGFAPEPMDRVEREEFAPEPESRVRRDAFVSEPQGRPRRGAFAPPPEDRTRRAEFAAEPEDRARHGELAPEPDGPVRRAEAAPEFEPPPLPVKKKAPRKEVAAAEPPPPAADAVTPKAPPPAAEPKKAEQPERGSATTAAAPVVPKIINSASAPEPPQSPPANVGETGALPDRPAASPEGETAAVQGEEVAGSGASAPDRVASVESEAAAPLLPVAAIGGPLGVNATIITAACLALLTLLTLAFVFRRGRAAPVPALARDISAVSLGKSATQTETGAKTGALTLVAEPLTGRDLDVSPTLPGGPPMPLGDAMPRTREEALQVLGMGVAPDFNEAAVKKIIDGLRLSWHPDHATDPADRAKRELRLKQINAAWDIIAGTRGSASPSDRH